MSRATLLDVSVQKSRLGVCLCLAALGFAAMAGCGGGARNQKPTGDVALESPSATGGATLTAQPERPLVFEASDGMSIIHVLSLLRSNGIDATAPARRSRYTVLIPDADRERAISLLRADPQWTDVEARRGAHRLEERLANVQPVIAGKPLEEAVAWLDIHRPAAAAVLRLPRLIEADPDQLGSEPGAGDVVVVVEMKVLDRQYLDHGGVMRTGCEVSVQLRSAADRRKWVGQVLYTDGKWVPEEARLKGGLWLRR